jgi:hypothetical protein
MEIVSVLEGKKSKPGNKYCTMFAVLRLFISRVYVNYHF